MNEKQLQVIDRFVAENQIAKPDERIDIFCGFQLKPLKLKLEFDLIKAQSKKLPNGLIDSTIDNKAIGDLLKQIEEVYRQIIKKEFGFSQAEAMNAFNEIIEKNSNPDEHPLFAEFSGRNLVGKIIDVFYYNRKLSIYKTFIQGLIINYQELHKIYIKFGICQFEWNPNDVTAYLYNIREFKPADQRTNTLYNIYKMWQIYQRGGQETSLTIYQGIKSCYYDFRASITELEYINNSMSLIDIYMRSEDRDLNQLFSQIENPNQLQLLDVEKIIAFIFMNIVCMGHGNNTGDEKSLFGIKFVPNVVGDSNSVFVIHFTNFYNIILKKIKAKVIHCTSKNDRSIKDLDFIRDVETVVAKSQVIISSIDQHFDEEKQTFNNSKTNFIDKLKTTSIGSISREISEEEVKNMTQTLSTIFDSNFSIENGSVSFKIGPVKGSINYASILSLANDMNNLWGAYEEFNEKMRIKKHFDEFKNLILFYSTAIHLFESEGSVAIELTLDANSINGFDVSPVIILK